MANMWKIKLDIEKKNTETKSLYLSFLCIVTNFEEKLFTNKKLSEKIHDPLSNETMKQRETM